jgi:hypothetical protein
MIFAFTMPARDGEQFAPDAFDSNIGNTIRLGGPIGAVSGVVTAARVAEDGSSVELTIDAIEAPETSNRLIDVLLRGEGT